MISTNTLGTLIDLYMDGEPDWRTSGGWHGARNEYPVREGSRNSEADNMKYALRDLRNTIINLKVGEDSATRTGLAAASHHLEDLHPDHFQPADLRAVQRHMIGIGLCRNQVNDRKNRILRFFRWMVSYGHCEQSTVDRLLNVTAVKPHYPGVRESKPVKSVDPSIVKKTLKCARPIVARAIGVQMLTGMRPKELVSMRLCDLRMSSSREAWEYLPEHHKTEHKRVRRIIKMGPEAQTMLREVISWRVSQGELADGEVRMPRMGDDDPRKVWPWNTVNGYYQAVSSAAKRAGVKWSPNQLRHYTLTLANAVLGLDTAAQVGGHTDKKTTQRHYVEPDNGLAEQFALKFG